MAERLTEIRRWSNNSSQPWVVDVLGKGYLNGYVLPDGTAGNIDDGGKYENKDDAKRAEVLYLIKCHEKVLDVETSARREPVRTFDTGATRDTVAGKLDYVKALCPLVLRRYVQYLDKHRLQPDGNMRDFDNWKKGIPRETYHSSKGRHFFADWLLEEGHEVLDNHGPVDEEDALCGELFNAMGKLRGILLMKEKN